MYLWVVITGGFFAFFAAMGIGSNDAANAFATSVGSKALTLRQASGLAIIFESAGAILMGNHVTDTIRKGIADYKCFEDNPDILMYGCMWVVAAVGSWLFLASYWEMPVSTTHSCVGGMIGMTIALKGANCVIWYKPIDTFPYLGGVSGIILSWFLSPLFSAFLASTIYRLTRLAVLRQPYESKRLSYLYPCMVGSTLTINSFFIIYKGAKGLNLHNIDISLAASISCGLGLGGGILIYPLVPKIKNYVDKKFLKNTTQIQNQEINLQLSSIENNKKYLNITSTAQLETIKNIHENAEKFDPKIEEVFKYLQIFTAICDSFSHGANDVANAIGPFAAIYTIYMSNGDLSKNLDMGDNAYLILGLGGIGIACGLLIYGKKIINAIGEKLCKITPSRGTCIELGSALVIITGSRLKIPLSTTHCQIGAETGIALCEKGNCSSINQYILIKTIFGWIITCIFVGITTGILVAQGAYSPPIESLNKTCFNYTLY